MQQLKILNKKEIKKLLELIKNQWGFKEELDYAFLINKKDKVYIINSDIKNIDLEKLKIDSIGLYFGENIKGEFRLSIEGSQIIGPHAVKNITEIDEKEKKEWLRGNDLVKELKGENGFIIIKSNEDYLGCGKYREGKTLNYIPKARRLTI